MSKENYFETASGEVPNISIERLLGWFNEQVDGVNNERAALADFLVRNPEWKERPAISAKIGRIAGSREMLEGFGAYLAVQAPGVEAQYRSLCVDIALPEDI